MVSTPKPNSRQRWRTLKNRQTFGDTTFITLPIENLPILRTPRALAAKAGVYSFVEPFLDLIEPTLTVLIETGYDRTIPYGQFTTARLFPITNPVKLAVDLVAAAGQGVAEAVQDVRSPTPPPAELLIRCRSSSSCLCRRLPSPPRCHSQWASSTSSSTTVEPTPPAHLGFSPTSPGATGSPSSVTPSPGGTGTGSAGASITPSPGGPSATTGSSSAGNAAA